MGGVDPKISLAQHKESQQHSHAGDAVLRAEYHAEKRHSREAERHHQINLKVIDQDMAPALFFILCDAD